MSSTETVVRIEFAQKFCALTYGSAPCTASLGLTGSKKCFNSWKTCQSKANFDGSALITWKFSNIHVAGHFPTLINVSTLPTELNVSGLRDASSPFGRRGQVSITLKDFAYNDALSDKYVTDRGYKPIQSGTFWSKFLARNPYYENTPIKIFQNDDERIYFIDKIEGPTSDGMVVISCVDPLRVLEPKKAIFPEPSTATITIAYDAEQVTNIQCTGNLSEFTKVYGNTGEKFIRIDAEILKYTGVSGADGAVILSGIQRAKLGTVAASHSINKTISRAVSYESVAVSTALNEMLSPYLTGYYNFAEWQAEDAANLSEYTLTSVIEKSRPIQDLIGEICQQSNSFMWWSEFEQKVKLLANVPRSSAVELNDENNILAGTFQRKVDTNSRITRVLVYYNRQNPTTSSNESSNYLGVSIRVDADAESINEYDDESVLVIYANWVNKEAVAFQLAARVLSKFRDGSEILTFMCDAKDSYVLTGDLVNVKHFALTNDEGLSVSQKYTVISSEQIKPGEIVMFEVEKSEFNGKYCVYTPDAALDFSSYSVQELIDNEYGFYADDNGLLAGGGSAYVYQ